MKRSLSILSVIALLVSLFAFAPVVKAEGNGDGTGSDSQATLDTTQPVGSGEQPGQSGEGSEIQAQVEKVKKQYKIRLQFSAKVKEDKNGDIKVNPVLVAKLIDKTDKEVGQVEGTWTVEVDGKVYKKFKDSKDKKIRVNLPENFSVVLVKFEGKIDGEDVTVKKKHEYTSADVEITHKEVNGKDEFTATIKGVEKAEGQWAIFLGDEEEELIDFKEGQGGASFTATFENLKPGKYLVVVFFEGTINDGDYVFLGNVMEFEKKENGGGAITPPEDGGKQPPVLDPDNTKKQIEESKKGGKMPKTATTYPAGALAGLVLLLVGFAALKLRRA